MKKSGSQDTRFGVSAVQPCPARIVAPVSVETMWLIRARDRQAVRLAGIGGVDQWARALPPEALTCDRAVRACGHQRQRKERDAHDPAQGT